MYKCKNCDSVFETPSKTSLDVFYGGVSEMGSICTGYIETCPQCDDNDFEEVIECGICEEYHFKDDMTDTEGMINGGQGYCCEQCVEDNDIR